MDAVVLQCSDHLEAGAVADMGEARILVAAEIALKNPAVLGAVEYRAPSFQLSDASGRFLGVKLYHPPVIDVLPAAHGVGEMDLPIVAIIDVGERGRDAAFSHDGVGFPQKRFAHQTNRDSRGGCFDSCAQSGAAGTDDEDIVFVGFVVHCCWLFARGSLLLAVVGPGVLLSFLDPSMSFVMDRK